MTIHFALSPDPECRMVACSSDWPGYSKRLRGVERRLLPRTTSTRLCDCGNCRRTRRFREACIEYGRHEG